MRNEIIRLLMERLLIIVAGTLNLSQASTFAAPPASSHGASDGESLDDFYRSKLAKADASDVEHCRRSDDVGLALQATWELVAREAVGLYGDDEEKVVRVSALDSAHRFVGFVEGKLPVGVPAWWINALFGADLEDGCVLWCQWKFQIDKTAPRPPDLPRYYRLDKELHWVADDDKGDDIGDLGRIHFGAQHLHLPPALIDQCRRGIPQAWLLTSASDTEARLVAVFDERYGFQGVGISCFPAAKIEPCWTADVWGGPPVGGGGTGIGQTHFVEIVTNHEAAYIFGFDAFSAYIEAFAKASGEPVFRFSTMYARQEKQ